MTTRYCHKKVILLIFPFILFFSTSFTDDFGETTIRIADESTLMISGTTNVSEFNCHYMIEEINEPMRVYYEQTNGKLYFSNTQLHLANDCFDCGGRGINRDFKELLKTESYPKIALRLMYIEKPNSNLDPIRAAVEITIAGHKRTYETFVICDQTNGLCIEGDLELCLSDFNLKPPTKALGIIKVNNEIKVSLRLSIKEV